MSTADRLWESYFRRMGNAPTAQRDAPYDYSLNVLRDLLRRLEVILEDEHVPPQTAERVLRCLLYGAPSEADAEERLRTQQEMMKLVQRFTPAPFLGREST